MKKITNIFELDAKLICWDLDGTLFDTEVMWYNMDELVTKQYGANLTKEEFGKASESIAADAYKTWGYREDADKVLNILKDKGLSQVIINKCDLTNKTMLKNDLVNNSFSFTNFDEIVSESIFKVDSTLDDMYKYAFEKYCSIGETAIAICDMPFELKAAKNNGYVTIWAMNRKYPFTDSEMEEIRKNSDFYVENFLDLIK